MDEELNMLFDLATESMQGAIDHLDKELVHISAGKANPRMLDGVMVDYYGTQTPISQVANISTPDSKTIAVQPWEKNMIPIIEKAILVANLGFNPDNNGELIRIFIPPLTEERRRDMSKQVGQEGEHAKISIRNARKEANDQLKDLNKEGLSEDDEKKALEKVQEMTNDFSKKVDDMVDKKNNDIMTI